MALSYECRFRWLAVSFAIWQLWSGFCFLSGNVGLAFFVDEPAVIIAEEAVCFHPSFPFTPDSILYSEIQRVLFARADRLPKSVSENIASELSPSASFGGNMGAKCRSALRIYYRSKSDKEKKVTIMDNAIEGGERAILQFGASLKRELKRRGLAAGKLA